MPLYSCTLIPTDCLPGHYGQRLSKEERESGMTTTFQELLNELAEAARTNRDKGTQFEKLIANYLMTDPQYADRLSDVWLWDSWPDRWGSDVGIDLVARERGTGDYWAIQCKFYDPAHSLQKADIDSFFTASGKRFATTDGDRHFSSRMLVCTTDKWSKHAEDALADQAIPVTRLWFKDLADSPIDWSQFSLSNVKDIRLTSSEPMRIGGQPGYETRATGKNAKTGEDIEIVQWLRFGAGAYIQMVGFAPKENWLPAFHRFRSVRDGLDLR